MNQHGPLHPPKPYKSYDELLTLMGERGMSFECNERAKRKLAQVGYYRLTGYSHVCREIKKESDGTFILCPTLRTPKRESNFLPDTSFNNIFNLYIFDKKLRILMMDALERIEVHIRSLIAHEVGKGHLKMKGSGALIPDPMAWNSSDYINPKHLKEKRNGSKSDWDNWKENHQKIISRCRDDAIVWHNRNSKSMPFWVVIEAWDFGTLSKYYGMLKETFRARICERLGLTENGDTQLLSSWLMSMNILRNRCAHHSRVWNQRNNNKISYPDQPFFNNLPLDDNTHHRLFGLIIVMQYLMQQIGPSSTWMNEVMSLLQHFPSLPGANLAAFGKPSTGFPSNEQLNLIDVTLVRSQT